MNPIPEDTESPSKRKDRHEAHQAMLKSHVDAKQARRELHKRTQGKVRPYPGHFY